jgi:hypothetical protein
VGIDAAFESVILPSTYSRATSLEGWHLKDRAGHSFALSGRVDAHGDREIRLARGQLPLNNMGDEVYLLGPDNEVQHQMAYTGGCALRGVDLVRHYLMGAGTLMGGGRFKGGWINKKGGAAGTAAPSLMEGARACDGKGERASS